MKIVDNRALGILQARMSSTRLPGKVLKKINGLPMLQIQLERIKRASSINQLIVATSLNVDDQPIYDFCKQTQTDVFRGSLENVFDRFSKIIEEHDGNYVIRLTGDCPLFMPDLCDEMFTQFLSKDFDYYSNTLKPTYPDGLDIEIFKKSAFEELKRNYLTAQELEHVTLGFYSRQNQFKCGNHENTYDLSNLRWTVDTQEDFEFISWVYAKFRGSEAQIEMSDILRLLESEPEMSNIDSGFQRNSKLKGQ